MLPNLAPESGYRCERLVVVNPLGLRVSLHNQPALVSLSMAILIMLYLEDPRASNHFSSKWRLRQRPSVVLQQRVHFFLGSFHPLDGIRPLLGLVHLLWFVHLSCAQGRGYHFFSNIDLLFYSILNNLFSVPSRPWMFSNRHLFPLTWYGHRFRVLPLF